MHVDADAFFVGCHVAEDPALSGRALAVAGDPKARHGIILAASYSARARGVRTAMPLAQALRSCPALEVIAPDGALYRRYSAALRRLFAEFTPIVEPFSIDEAWLDMTGGLAPWRDDPMAAAEDLRRRARADLRLAVSVGISSGKMLAKQATELAKPDGARAVWPKDVPEVLWPLPVERLFGCGPAAADRLRSAGLGLIGDLARAPEEALAGLGQHGAALVARAWGRDAEPVRPPRQEDTKSLSAETTLSRDLFRAEDVGPILLDLADQVAARLRGHAVEGRVVTLKYKTASFRSHTRQTRLAEAASDTHTLYAAALALFSGRPSPEPVRLLGLGVSALVAADAAQALLWDGGRARRHRLAAAVDRIRLAYGDDAIVPARLVGRSRARRGGSSFEKPWRAPGAAAGADAGTGHGTADRDGSDPDPDPRENDPFGPG